DLRELAVFGERGDAVIDRAVGNVGVPVLFKLLDDGDHLAYVRGRARHDFRALATRDVEVLPEGCDVRRGVLGNRHALLVRLLDDAVVNVRDVHDVGDSVAFALQVAAADVHDQP